MSSVRPNDLSPRRPQLRSFGALAALLLAVFLGAAAGFFYSPSIGFVAIGSLVGFLIGRPAYLRLRGTPIPNLFPNAHLSVAQAVTAWLLLIGVWIWAVSDAGFPGEGTSMLLIYVLLPATTLFWLVGGPLASNNARAALLLSRAMTVAVIAFILWLFISMIQ